MKETLKGFIKGTGIRQETPSHIRITGATDVTEVSSATEKNVKPADTKTRTHLNEQIKGGKLPPSFFPNLAQTIHLFAALNIPKFRKSHEGQSAKLHKMPEQHKLGKIKKISFF